MASETINRDVVYQLALSDVKLHPNNIRKEYEGIEELADSIRSRGILQNLVVIPDPEEANKYIVLVGNRRYLAAIEAGLETIPCKISEGMDDGHQITTMIAENMNRKDITWREQVAGMQMCFSDFGMSTEDIAKETGLSKTTINRRLNVAKLDQEILEEKVTAFNLTFTDITELEKIPDVEKRNEILKKSTSGNDLRWKVENEYSTRRKKIFVDGLVAELEELGIEKAPDDCQTWKPEWNEVKKFYFSDMDEISLDGAPRQELLVFDVEQGVELFWKEDYSGIVIVSYHEIEEEEHIPTEAEIAAQKRKEEINALGKECEKIISDLKSAVIGIIEGKYKPIDKEPSLEHLFAEVLKRGTNVSYGTFLGFFRDGGYWYSLSDEERQEITDKVCELSPVHQCIILLYNKLPEDCNDYSGRYNTEDGEQVMEFVNILSMYGFSLDPDDIAILSGADSRYLPAGSEDED